MYRKYYDKTSRHHEFYKELGKEEVRLGETEVRVRG